MAGNCQKSFAQAGFEMTVRNRPQLGTAYLQYREIIIENIVRRGGCRGFDGAGGHHHRLFVVGKEPA